MRWLRAVAASPCKKFQIAVHPAGVSDDRQHPTLIATHVLVVRTVACSLPPMGERLSRHRRRLDGARPLDVALADYQRRRDATLGPMYDFTTDLAAFNPPRLADQHLLASLHGRQAEIDRFLGIFAGATPIRQYRSPRNALRLLGMRGLTKITAATLGQALRGSVTVR